MNRPASLAALLAVAAVLAACTTGERGHRRPRGADPVPGDVTASAEPPPQIPNGPERIEGTPPVRVVWEALAVEIEQTRTSRNRQSSLPQFGEPDLEVQLLNASFTPTPDQTREMRSQRAAGRTARVSDADMNDLLKELQKLGFFDYARPTESVRPYFASDRARGRITVERDGESVTLVSQRGLGLNDATKEIPAIYAQAKYAIQMLKNRAPALSVTGAKVSPADLEAMKRSGAKGGAAPAPSK